MSPGKEILLRDCQNGTFGYTPGEVVWYIPAPMYAVPRAPGWEKVRDAHLLLESTCRGCRTRYNLEVHHKKPFHLFPKLELVQTNLLTVCRNCHFVICHANNWQNYVEDVEVEIDHHWELVQKCKAKLSLNYPDLGKIDG